MTKRILAGILAIGCGLVSLQAVQWDITKPSGSFWSDDSNWLGGAKPSAEEAASFGKWETNPGGTYTVVVKEPQVFGSFALTDWNNPPNPFYIGTEEDVQNGNTLTFANLTRPSNISGTAVIVADVILSDDGVWSVNKGWNGEFQVLGRISGNHAIEKTGNGTLLLCGRNTYTGKTTITAGTLQLGNGDGRTGELAGDVEVLSELIVNPAAGDTTTMKNLSGTGTLRKKGLGTLVFSGRESLSSSGSFSIERHYWQNSSAGALDCTIPGGRCGFSSQVWNDDFTFAGTESMDFGDGPVTLKQTQSNYTRTVTVLKNTLTVGGSIGESGGFSLTKAGAGDLVLKGSNSYSKNTTIKDGRLILEAEGTMGAGAVSIGADGEAVLDNGEQIANRLPDGQAVTLGGKLTLHGSSSGAVTEEAGALTLAVGPACVAIRPAGAETLLTFASFAERKIGNTTIFDIPENGKVSVGGMTAGEMIPGALAKTGGATGFATVDEAGAVCLAVADGAENVKMDLQGDTTIEAGEYGTLEFCNRSGASVTVTLSGTISTTKGLLFSGDSPIVLTGGTIAGNADGEVIVLTANTAMATIETPVEADDITYGGVGDLAISGRQTAKSYANGYITLNVDGTVTWAQTNPDCGAVRLYGGTVVLAKGSRLYEKNSYSSGDRCYLQVGGNAVLDLHGVSVWVNGISGSGIITNRDSESLAVLNCKWSPSGSNYYTYQPNFSGSLQGNLRLSLSSDGYYYERYTQILSGDNSHTGGTVLSSGVTLNLRHPHALGAGSFSGNATAAKVKAEMALTLDGVTELLWKSHTYNGASLDMGEAPAFLNATQVNVSVTNTVKVASLGEIDEGSSFTKSGLGNLVVKGDAMYTGETTISAGTLTFEGNVESRVLNVEDSATLTAGVSAAFHPKTLLTVAQNGIIKLHNEVPIQISSISVDGVEYMASGTYGAIGSGARYQLPCFTGTGQLQIRGGVMLFIR
ncbi:MAG: autotransporter-associated beta strand repeat-containing protein [Kiritimatiellia bacterium]